MNLADFVGKTPLYICVNNAIVHSCKSAIVKLISGGAIVDKYVRKTTTFTLYIKIPVSIKEKSPHTVCVLLILLLLLILM